MAAIERVGAGPGRRKITLNPDRAQPAPHSAIAV